MGGYRRRCRARTSTSPPTPSGARPQRCSPGSRGSAKFAGELLREAATSAAALRAQPLQSEIADLARRAGTNLGGVATDGDSDDDPVAELTARGLTSREVEVLRLLGEGRSNREIGEALFISAKTASVHVTHILQKLNVATRVQAAVAAHRLVQPPRRVGRPRRRTLWHL